MDNVKGIGNDGMGSETYTKYPLESAPVTLHGGNDAIHEAVRTEEGTGAKVDELSEGFGK